MEEKLPWWARIELYDAKENGDSWSMEKMLCTWTRLLGKGRWPVASKRCWKQANRMDSEKRPSTKAETQTSASQAVVEKKGTGRTDDKLSIRPCVFCEEEHFGGECHKYRSCDEWLERLRVFKVCFICYKGAHAAKGCHAKIKCYLCELDCNSALWSRQHWSAVDKEKLVDKKNAKAEGVKNVNVDVMVRAAGKVKDHGKTMLNLTCG